MNLAVIGTLVHTLFQQTLAIWEETRFVAPDFPAGSSYSFEEVKSTFSLSIIPQLVTDIIRSHSSSLLTVRLSDAEAEEILKSYIPSITQFIADSCITPNSLSSTRTHTASIIPVRSSTTPTPNTPAIYHLLANEDTVIVPTLGLKGRVDCTIQLKSTDPTHSLLISALDLKSGKPRFSKNPHSSQRGQNWTKPPHDTSSQNDASPKNEHVGQVALYSSLLRHTYSTPSSTGQRNLKLDWKDGDEGATSHSSWLVYLTKQEQQTRPSFTHQTSQIEKKYFSFEISHSLPETVALLIRRNEIATSLRSLTLPQRLDIEDVGSGMDEALFSFDSPLLSSLQTFHRTHSQSLPRQLSSSESMLSASSLPHNGSFFDTTNLNRSCQYCHVRTICGVVTKFVNETPESVLRSDMWDDADSIQKQKRDDMHTVSVFGNQKNGKQPRLSDSDWEDQSDAAETLKLDDSDNWEDSEPSEKDDPPKDLLRTSYSEKQDVSMPSLEVVQQYFFLFWWDMFWKEQRIAMNDQTMRFEDLWAAHSTFSEQVTGQTLSRLTPLFTFHPTPTSAFTSFFVRFHSSSVQRPSLLQPGQTVILSEDSADSVPTDELIGTGGFRIGSGLLRTLILSRKASELSLGDTLVKVVSDVVLSIEKGAKCPPHSVDSPIRLELPSIISDCSCFDLVCISTIDPVLPRHLLPQTLLPHTALSITPLFPSVVSFQSLDSIQTIISQSLSHAVDPSTPSIKFRIDNIPFDGSNYQFTIARGHLVSLFIPESMDRSALDRRTEKEDEKKVRFHSLFQKMEAEEAAERERKRRLLKLLFENADRGAALIGGKEDRLGLNLEILFRIIEGAKIRKDKTEDWEDSDSREEEDGDGKGQPVVENDETAVTTQGTTGELSETLLIFTQLWSSQAAMTTPQTNRIISSFLQTPTTASQGLSGLSTQTRQLIQSSPHLMLAVPPFDWRNLHFNACQLRAFASVFLTCVWHIPTFKESLTTIPVDSEADQTLSVLNVIGLPGSGKTHLIVEITHALLWAAQTETQKEREKKTLLGQNEASDGDDWDSDTDSESGLASDAFVSLGKQIKSAPFRILVCGHTHNSVDNILFGLWKRRVPFIRVGKDKHIDKEIRQNAARVLNRKKGPQKERTDEEYGFDEESAMRESKSSFFVFPPTLHSHIKHTISHIQSQSDPSFFELVSLVSSIPVVGMTVLSFSSLMTSSDLPFPLSCLFHHFDLVIVDEASQVLLPSSLPLFLQTPTILFVGDPYQLPPLIRSKRHDMSNSSSTVTPAHSLHHDNSIGVDTPPTSLHQSIFNHLSSLSPTAFFSTSPTQPNTSAPSSPFSSDSFVLEDQYRMNRGICDLLNGLVYRGTMRCGNDLVANRTFEVDPLLLGGLSGWLRVVLDPATAVAFVDTDGSEEVAGMRKQHSNETEASLVKQIVESLLSCGTNTANVRAEHPIGVITPYRAQVRLIRSVLEENTHKKDNFTRGIDVHTVDSFQGKERDVIIISLVQSASDMQHASLLADKQRLNVALSRARRKIVIVGSKNAILRENDFTQNSALVQLLALFPKEENSPNHLTQIFRQPVLVSPWENG
ncbi:putative DNA replication ATP-dependent helicase/nuclease DNA2 [Blattamonas nauphoetae]|uniref:DNA helicase n=1 Tax=Blattamonas nauphoetae TaxID=2049346 RepID=A0ABQ9YGB2_9EUKA|nr:putative DNA replication ATP-dependent helicase/nuclease DNA2 [Blattamonas nauphoetae]